MNLKVMYLKDEAQHYRLNQNVIKLTFVYAYICSNVLLIHLKSLTIYHFHLWIPTLNTLEMTVFDRSRIPYPLNGQITW